jgi:hypothetical protein
VAFLESLCAKTRPALIVVCMIYYPDELGRGSWADNVLRWLGYNSDPAKLQLIISRVFAIATSQIRIPGVRVVPFPMYSVMDGKTSADYVERVEPSAEGGRKLAGAPCSLVLGRINSCLLSQVRLCTCELAYLCAYFPFSLSLSCVRGANTNARCCWCWWWREQRFVGN